jgi:hypothetical protein
MFDHGRPPDTDFSPSMTACAKVMARVCTRFFPRQARFRKGADRALPQAPLAHGRGCRNPPSLPARRRSTTGPARKRRWTICERPPGSPSWEKHQIIFKLRAGDEQAAVTAQAALIVLLAGVGLVVTDPAGKFGDQQRSLALSALVRVVVQDAAPENPPTLLPAVQLLKAPSRDFSFNVPLLLPYDQASGFALASRAKKTPRVSGMIVKISRLQILPSGQEVVVATRLCADPVWDTFGWFAFCSDVYLCGAPVFDPAQKTIRIDSLHYDLASANLVLNALKVLAGNFTALFQRELVIRCSHRKP